MYILSKNAILKRISSRRSNVIKDFELKGCKNSIKIGDVAFDIIYEGGVAAQMEYCACNDEGVVEVCGVGEIEDKIIITPVNGGVICQRKVKNVTNKDLHLKELKVNFTGINLGGAFIDDYFYCNENHRLYGVYTLPLDFDRLNDSDGNKKYGISVDKRWNDPDAINERILNSPYQAFPAIHLGNYQSDLGIVHGTLSQDVFFHNYELGHDEDGAYLSAYSAFKSIAYRILKVGETLTDEWYLGITENAGDINRVFDGYTERLRKVITNPRARNSTNKNGVSWSSWNDGVYRDVSEDLLVKEAYILKENFSTAKWLQLDDGYSTYCDPDVDNGAHGIGVVYEGEEGIDAKKFPNGLKGYTNKIKKAGIHPSIWVGGFVPHPTKMYRECPDMFIDYSYRVDDASPLDVSIPKVREYMVNALDKFFKEWGFEGVKHDFWSYAFEDSKDLLKYKDKSGYEYRKWWLNEIRKRLPEFGYMQTGCDLCMGNPFLGEFFDNYRFGLDVGSGKWLNVKTTLFWGCACFMTHTGDLFISNGDSIGLMEGLTDSDFYFLLNYLLITHSLVEISGLYSKAGVDNERLKVLRRVTKGLNNGASVYFANFDYRKKDAYIPQIMYTKTPCFEDANYDDKRVLTVALFNAEETETAVSFTVKDVGLLDGEYKLIDVWNGVEREGGAFSVNLAPHQSKLFYLVKE